MKNWAITLVLGATALGCARDEWTFIPRDAATDGQQVVDVSGDTPAIDAQTVDVADDVPAVDATGDVAADGSVDAPGDVPADAQVDDAQAADVPADVQPDMPTADTPIVDVPADVPFDAPADVATDRGPDVPADVQPDVPCPSGGTLCGSGCVDLTRDPDNCGTCGRECSLSNATAGCAAGACTVAMCAPNFADCDGNPANGCEVNTQTSSAHCGMCNRACSLANASSACAVGACTVTTCNAGFANCDGSPANGCEVNTRTSAAHCGGCGRTCALANASSTCTAGACAIASCNTGFGDCDSLASDGCEINLTNDRGDCGMCNNACVSPQVCSSSACSTVCGAGETACGLNCVDTRTSPTDCNGCGNTCPTRANSTSVCAASTCGFICGAGFGDCDMAAGNGCETNTQTTLAHCGACGRACAPANASASCASGACTIASCSTGFRDCDGNVATGCEVNVTTSASHCGACNNACAAVPNGTTACVSSACAITTCAAGFRDCDGSYANGCEVDTRTSAGNCGACNNACSARPNAAASCSASACGLGACNAGFANCDSDASNGCEVNLQTTLAHCGACNRACAPANASASCASGACTIASCSTGFRDCDTNVATGCEVNVTNDAAHCGACNNACGAVPNGTTACASSACSITACNTGFRDCDGNYANGCELTVASFPSTGADGAFNPVANVVLAARVYNYTTINIPAGVTVTTNGTGVLELRATGAVTIAGTVDVSGGAGGRAVASTNGGNGGGGQTGSTVAGSSGINGARPTAAGGGSGTAGGNCTCSGCSPVCPGGAFGGGAGGQGITSEHVSGAGGGGYGGGGGGGGYRAPGAAGGGASAGGGGSSGCFSPGCGGGGGGGGEGAYAGGGGGVGTTSGPGCGSCSPVSGGGGGGGSIGTDAVADLLVATTFRPGSGGGGGGHGTDSCQGGGPGSGGGGGGGALRVTSTVSVSLTSTGRLVANGGAGAASTNDGGGGGGGSGGVVYVTAPTLSIVGNISAVGGTGGGNSCGGAGGGGGLGRIRLGTRPSACTITGTLNPPLPGGCTPATPVSGNAVLVAEAPSCT